MDKHKGKQKVEEAEDWCFVCYNGGRLLVCDHKGCGKVYHPNCVGKKNSVLKSKGCWICARHSCHGCGASPQLYCLCCPKAFCNLCETIDFVPAKSDKGLCKTCYDLTVRCKKNAEINSEMDIIDIEDEDLEMFKGYLEIIMKEEDLTFDDLFRARLKSPDSVAIVDKDCIVKISGGERVKDPAPIDMSPGKRNKPEIKKYDRTPSKVLIEFLSSIDVAAPANLTRCHVDIKISRYILRENLFVDEEQDTVRCDEKLYSLFQKKQLHKNQIYDLLLQHFDATSGQTNMGGTPIYSGNKVEEIDAESKCQRTLSSGELPVEEKIYASATVESKTKRTLSPDKASLEDKVDYAVQESDSSATTERKRQRTLSTDKVSLEDKVDSPVQKSEYASATAESESHRTLSPVDIPIAVQKSQYASIVVENMKLVYLRKGVIVELLKDPDNFEDKVVGSFVRVKRMPIDSSVKPAFRLLQVTGIKKTAIANINKEIRFEVSCLPDDIPIDKLNDDDILEEECLDLQQRMRDGILEKPTVLELEHKANRLHEDITKHWIQRELVRLQSKIDYYHEKKCNTSLSRCWDEKKKLEKSSEQQRLLKDLPRVIAEEIEIHSTTRDSSESSGAVESDRQKSTAETQSDC